MPALNDQRHRQGLKDYSIERPPRGEHRRPTFILVLFRGRLSRNEVSSWPSQCQVYVCLGFVQLVLGTFSATLGGLSAGSSRFLVDSRRICSEFLVGFRFCWRWTQFLEVLEGLRYPVWSQDGPKGGHREPRKAPRTIKKTQLFLQSVLGSNISTSLSDFCAFSSILGTKALQNRSRNR